MTLRRRWVRSYPVIFDDRRNYVVDHLPRLLIDQYDLASNPDSWTVLRDCTLLEWDIVVRPIDMQRWETRIGSAPDRVHVAPYPVYAGPGYPQDDWQSVGDGDHAERFGFGMIWFPANVVDAFHRAEHNPHAAWFTDGTFAAWYTATYGPATVQAGIRPVHLNYRVTLPTAPDQG